MSQGDHVRLFVRSTTVSGGSAITSPPEATEPVDVAAGQQDGPVNVDANGGAAGGWVTSREITVEVLSAGSNGHSQCAVEAVSAQVSG